MGKTLIFLSPYLLNIKPIFYSRDLDFMKRRKKSRDDRDPNYTVEH